MKVKFEPRFTMRICHQQTLSLVGYGRRPMAFETLSIVWNKILITCVTLIAVATVSFGQSTLYYDRANNPGWLAPNAWSTSGDPGTFNTTWVDGSIAAFGSGGSISTNQDPTLEDQTIELGGLINTGGIVTFRRPGPFGTEWFTLVMQNNPQIDGNFNWELVNVENGFEVVGGRVRIGQSISSIDGVITLDGGDYEIILGGTNGATFQTHFVIDDGQFRNNLRALVEVGSIDVRPSGSVVVGHPNGFTGSPTVVRDFGGTGGFLAVADGGTAGGGDVSPFTVDHGEGVDREFAGSINGDGPVSGNTMEFIKTGAGNLTLSGQIEELPLTVVRGTGSLIITGANNQQTGDTVVESGTLVAGHSSALGTSQVFVTGDDQAVVRIAEGEEIGNSIFFSSTHAASRLEHTITESAAFRTGTSGEFRSDFADGRRSTTVEFLGGTASAERTLFMSFANTSTAANDALRLSDVFTLSGTDGDVFVLQLGVSHLDSTEASSYLAWFDGDHWVNAIADNSILGEYAVQGFMGSFADSEAEATLAYLGSYGIDLDNNVVWAVLDHNSQFAVIPEPSAILLLAMALGSLVIRRYNRKRRKL